MRTLLLTVTLIVGLLTVAVPVCTTGVCDFAAGLSSGGASVGGGTTSGAMPGGTMAAGSMSHDAMASDAMSHDGMAAETMSSGAMSHDTMAPGGAAGRTTTVFRAVCTMATMAAGVVQNALPPSSPTLPIGLFAALALAFVSLLPRLTQFSLPALVGDPPGPPGDPRGVCLLI